MRDFARLWLEKKEASQAVAIANSAKMAAWVVTETAIRRIAALIIAVIALFNK